MAEVQDLLRRLRRAGVRLWLQDGKVCYWPQGSINADDLLILRRHRPEVIRQLYRQSARPEHGIGFDANRAADDLLAGDRRLPMPQSDVPTHVLLTGATGFVGAYVLAELLARGDTTVHCLVRAEARDEARRRVLASLERTTRPATGDEASRIRVVTGDLAQPLLGLDDDAFQALADAIDAIAHVGANVHGLLPYGILAEANVHGTGQLLKLALTRKMKYFHYISTVAAGSPHMRQSSGYTETKWHGELLVDAVHGRGLPTAIYRLPRILGNKQWNDRDVVQRLLHDILALGVAPDIFFEEDWLSAEILAKFLTDMILRRPDGERIIVSTEHPVRIDEVIELAAAGDRQLSVTAMSDWVRILADRAPEEAAIMAELLTPATAGGAAPEAAEEEEKDLACDDFTCVQLPGPTPGTLRRYITELGHGKGNLAL